MYVPARNVRLSVSIKEKQIANSANDPAVQEENGILNKEFEQTSSF